MSKEYSLSMSGSSARMQESLLAARERILASAALFADNACPSSLPEGDRTAKWRDRLAAKCGFVQDFCSRAREAALFVHRFADEKNQRVGQELAAQTEFRQQQALYEMETGKRKPTPLFSELKERCGSAFLARVFYAEVKKERERAQWEKEWQQEREISRTRGRSR